MPSFPRALGLAAVLALLPSCLNVSPPGTTFASEPPGARVHVDGRDSGWVTPCRIALDTDEPHVVTLAMDGYAPREVRLTPLNRRGLVSWSLGVNAPQSTIHFPILLPAWDLFFPIRDWESQSPARVFVRLRPDATP